MPTSTLWTIGHSNRQQAEFIKLLVEERIESLADVRRFPGSRRCPQFGRDALEGVLQQVAIEYRHSGDLGGRRTRRAEGSVNSAWRVEAFNAYADYMMSREFVNAFDELLELAQRKRTAIMCAEALPWRCHRRLIADQFVARGWKVIDIVGSGQIRDHVLPDFAKVVDGMLTYPGQMLF